MVLPLTSHRVLLWQPPSSPVKSAQSAFILVSVSTVLYNVRRNNFTVDKYTYTQVEKSHNHASRDINVNIEYKIKRFKNFYLKKHNRSRI